MAGSTRVNRDNRGGAYQTPGRSNIVSFLWKYSLENVYLNFNEILQLLLTEYEILTRGCLKLFSDLKINIISSKFHLEFIGVSV